MISKEEILKRLEDATNGTCSFYYDDATLKQFARYYSKRLDDKATDDDIVNTFIEYSCEVLDMECRRCSACGNLMREGYCIDGGCDYYCSDDCLHTKFTDEEWAEEYKHNDQSYYTEWY